MKKIILLLGLVIGLAFGQVVPPAGGGSNNTGAVPANAAVAVADGATNTARQTTDAAGNALSYQDLPMIFNGTTWDRQHSAALANMPASVGGGASVSAGAALVERGGRLTLINAPATSSQATSSVAANATARHVISVACWSATANAAVAATDLTVVVRDGATGAGTIIAQWNIAAVVAAGAGIQSVPPFCTPELGLVGTTNTAMTVEFSAGVTNLNEAITATFYNVQ